jgi:hypothetical protein
MGFMGMEDATLNGDVAKEDVMEFLKKRFTPQEVVGIEAVPYTDPSGSDHAYIMYVAAKTRGGEVYCTVALTAWDTTVDLYIDRSVTKTELRYKFMQESLGPYFYDCPESILNLLTPTDSIYAKQWREKCRNTIKNKN